MKDQRIERWLNFGEKCFGVLEWYEERKVKLATILLQGSAEDWWILYVVGGREVDFVLWGGFRRSFRKSFIPICLLMPRGRIFLA